MKKHCFLDCDTSKLIAETRSKLLLFKMCTLLYNRSKKYFASSELTVNVMEVDIILVENKHLLSYIYLFSYSTDYVVFTQRYRRINS